MFPKGLMILVVLALAVAVYAHPSGGAGKPQTYVVKPTDTLWSIAASHYPGDTRAAVWRLERSNHLGSVTLTPGQRLRLP